MRFLLALLLTATSVLAQTTATTDPVGFITQNMNAGANLIAPALGTPAYYDAAKGQTTIIYQAFSLSSFMVPYSSSIPLQTSVSLWNPASLTWSTPSVMTGAGWSIDYPMAVGVGLLVNAPENFSFVSSGSVRLFGPTGNFTGFWSPQGDKYRGYYEGDGPQWYDADQPLGNGYYLLGAGVPVDSISFQDMFGRNPLPGEEIVTLDNSYTFMSDGNWSGEGYYSSSSPTIDAGKAAFFNLGPVAVPEPSTYALLALGAGALMLARRRR